MHAFIVYIWTETQNTHKNIALALEPNVWLVAGAATATDDEYPPIGCIVSSGRFFVCAQTPTHTYIEKNERKIGNIFGTKWRGIRSENQ